jgi:hypothetical protein
MATVIDPITRGQFEKMGAESVRAMLGEWSGYVKAQALEWLGERDRADRERDEASKTAQIFLARESNELVRTAKDAALSANDLAAEANAIARDANSIALAASASAERSAVAAITNNKIAKAALIAALIAIAISIAGIFVK